MSIFSFSQLRQEAMRQYDVPVTEAASLRTASASSVADRIRASKDSDNKQYDIFLSHSFQDRLAILGLKAKFEKMGHATYVDWICDPQLNRTSINKETSKRLRLRMKNSKTLFYAFSLNATQSRWMPWELGFIDGEKERCAVLRVEEAAGEFSYHNFEYLEIYPYVTERAAAGLNSALWIHESPKRYAYFPDWAKGQSLQDH